MDPCIRKRSVKAYPAFTIVELLIVIVVIAILATISIVAYKGIQERAVAATVKSDLENFAKKIEMVKVDSSSDTYPALGSLTQGMGLKATKSVYMTTRYNWYYCTSPDGSNYSLGVIDKNNKTYFQSSNQGMYEGTAGSMDSTINCDKVGSPPNYNGGFYWTDASTNGWRSWVN